MGRTATAHWGFRDPQWFRQDETVIPPRMTFCNHRLQIPRYLCNKPPNWCLKAAFLQEQFLSGFKEWKRENIFLDRPHSRVSAKPTLCLTPWWLGYTVLKLQQLLQRMPEKWDLLPHDLCHSSRLQISAACSTSDGKCLQSSSVETQKADPMTVHGLNIAEIFPLAVTENPHRRKKNWDV